MAVKRRSFRLKSESNIIVITFITGQAETFDDSKKVWRFADIIFITPL